MNLIILAMGSLFALCFLPTLYIFFLFFIIGLVESLDRLIKRLIDLVFIVFDIILSFPVIFIGLAFILFRRNIL